MNASLEYLLSYLQDEFAACEGVRVRLAPIEQRMRSPDLVQEFDDERPPAPRGVIVKVGSRDYFFPESWVAGKRFGEIRQLADEIRDKLD